MSVREAGGGCMSVREAGGGFRVQQKEGNHTLKN